MSRGLTGMASTMASARPRRYRSTSTGRYVSEEFAREHPDDTRAVGRRPSRPVVLGALVVLIGLGVSAAAYHRAQR
jgi:hypothetical protein